MELLLVADQKVEPGWICGPEGLQQPCEVIRWTSEKRDGRRKYRCFRSKELQKMIVFNPDLQRAPWFSSIPDLNQDGFLLLVHYRITEIRTGIIRTDNCVHTLSVGPVASVLFIPDQLLKNQSELLDRLECNLKEFLKTDLRSTIESRNFEVCSYFSKKSFYGGKKGIPFSHQIYSIPSEYILGTDSAHVPIFAHINVSPVVPEILNFAGKDPFEEFEGSQVSKRQKTSGQCDEHTRVGPVTRSRCKEPEDLSHSEAQHVPGSLTKENSGSQITRSLSQSSRHISSITVTLIKKETLVTVDTLGAAGSSSSQTYKFTQPHEHVSRTGYDSAGLQNSQVVKATETSGPCAASTDLRGKLRDTDIVSQSSKSSKAFDSGTAQSRPCTSEGILYNDRTTSYTSSSIPINNAPIHTTHSASTATPHTNIATTYTTTGISITNTSLTYTDTRTTPACTNAEENVKPVQHPSKSPEKPLPTPDAPQRLGTSSSSADGGQRCIEAINRAGSNQPPTGTTTFSEDGDSEFAIPRTGETHYNSACQQCYAVSFSSNAATSGSKLDESSKAVTPTRNAEISTSSLKDRTPISSPGNKTTTEAQGMRSATSAEDAGGTNSAQGGKDSPSSLGTEIPTSDFIDRTTSSAQGNRTDKYVPNGRNATSARDTKTATSALGTKTTTSSQDANTIASAQEIKTVNMPQDNKTANSSQDNKTAASAQDLKTINTAQNKETPSYAQITKNSVPVQDIKTTLAENTKTTSCAQSTKSIGPTQDTETTTLTKNKKTSSAQDAKSTPHKSAASSIAQVDSTDHTGVHKSGATPSGQLTGESKPKRAATLKLQFLEPRTPTSCCEAKDDKYGIRRKAFGTAPAAAKRKTVLLLGVKGSGKTCLINAVANFIFGIKSDSEKKLTVSEEAVNTGGFGSTENITGYSFVIKEEDVMLTLIDTPGLNDSSGIEVRDHVDSFKTFLANAAQKDLEIHAIALVVQAHMVRLTSSERLVMDHLKTLFGQDVSGHVVNLITFADNQSKPPVVEALNHYGISTRYCFKFNNSVFCGSSDESEKELDRAYWKTSLKSWKKCLKVVKDLGPLKTNAMKSIQKELYVTNMRDAAIRELQAEVKALQKILRDPYSNQVEEVRQRVWDMARVVLRTLQTTDPGNYLSLWSLVEDIVCHTCKEQAKEVTEFLLVGSPMHLKDAIVAILKGNCHLNLQLKEMERRAKDKFSYKTKNTAIKDILFKLPVDVHDAGAFPQANHLAVTNTAKAVSHLIRGKYSDVVSKAGVVKFLNSLEEEVEPPLCGFLKKVCEHIP